MLDGNPASGEVLANPSLNAALAQALSLPAGREWRFALDDGNWALSVQLGLLGETALVSDKGARLLACHNDLLFALHQRSGPADRVFDAFALAFGLTPLTEKPCFWRDTPAVDLLGLTRWQRLRVLLHHPLGANIESRYERQWDSRSALWVQRGWHRLSALGGDIVAQSVGCLSERDGPVGFRLRVAGCREIRAGLAGFGNQGDHGVPAWSVDIGHSPATPLLTP